MTRRVACSYAGVSEFDIGVLCTMSRVACKSIRVVSGGGRKELIPTRTGKFEWFWQKMIHTGNPTFLFTIGADVGSQGNNR